jgi:hypothetical protein
MHCVHQNHRFPNQISFMDQHVAVSLLSAGPVPFYEPAAARRACHWSNSRSARREQGGKGTPNALEGWRTATRRQLGGVGGGEGTAGGRRQEVGCQGEWGRPRLPTAPTPLAVAANCLEDWGSECVGVRTRQGAGDRRQEAGERRQEAGDRRPESRKRRRTGNRR